MRSIRKLFALVMMVALLPASLWGQGLRAKPEYSDKDKKKLAEIAQRPEIQDRIQMEWEALRRKDMEFAYNANTSTRIAQMYGPEWADFRSKYGQLYDNPILQKYVNAVGQRLVPKDSPNLYAVKLLLDPVPRAEALSTGTIYISTGLISLLDNEAQLAYVVSHEIAHVERNHHYTKLRNAILDEELDRVKEAEGQKKKAMWGLIGAAAGAAVGGIAAGGDGAQWGLLGGGLAGYGIASFVYRNKFQPTDWEGVTENEADEAGLKYMLEQNFDAREIPRLYARMDNLVARDARLGLGFVGSPARTRERTANIQALLSGSYKGEIDRRLQNAGLVGSSPDFSLLMAALKRDNGIIALDYDLYAMAKDNLEEAAQFRSNDPRVHYHLGRVLALTARTGEEKQQALASFLKGIQYDAERGAYPDLHLEHALHLISQNNPALQEEIQSELKTFVALYQREHAGALPPNMPIIYDYFLLAGNGNWYVPPSAVVSTKNVDALYVTPVSSAPPTQTKEVVDRATGRAAEKPAPLPASATAPLRR